MDPTLAILTSSGTKARSILFTINRPGAEWLVWKPL